MNRKEKAAARKAQVARLEAAFAANRAIVAGGKCPDCGRPLKRNLALAGWFMCEQKGAEGFRKDAALPPCGFQCFVE